MKEINQYKYSVKQCLEKINYKWLLIAIVFGILNFLVHYREVTNIFSIPSKKLFVYYFFVRIIGFLVFVLVLYYFETIIYSFKKGTNSLSKSHCMFYLVYFFFNIIVLLLVWPGIFKGDEFSMIKNLTNGVPLVWVQSWISSFFYEVCLSIFPYIVSITFFQIVIIALLATKIFELLEKNLLNKKLAWLILIPFSFLPVLDNNMFTLRLSLIAWINAYVAVSVFCSIQNGCFFNTQNQIKTISLLGLVSAWKNEYLIVFLFFLVVDFFAVIIYRKFDKRVFLSMLIGCIVFFVFNLPVYILQPKDNYSMTAIFTPLSACITNNESDFINNKKLREEYTIINSITPVDEIVKTSRYINLPTMYWQLPYISETEKAEWLKASVKVCLYYYKDFLRNRLYIYEYTNGFIPDVVNHTGMEDPNIVLNLEYKGKAYFKDHFNYTEPLFGSSIRKNIISDIACRNRNDYFDTNVLYHIFYNSFIPLLIIFLQFCINLIKKNYKYCLFYFGVVLIVPVLFILCPGVFWMYYMPFYLSSYTLIFSRLFSMVDNYSRYIKLGGVSLGMNVNYKGRN